MPARVSDRWLSRIQLEYIFMIYSYLEPKRRQEVEMPLSEHPTDDTPQARPSEDVLQGVGESRIRAILKAAYRRSKARGFEPGHEFEDWLAAAQEIDTGIKRS